MNKIDTKEKALDYAIRESNFRDKKSEHGYCIEKKKYENYMSNEAWNDFLCKMNPLHKAQFNDADGGELDVKKGRYGLYPPKMASYGSSSRFVYNQSKDISGFIFEKLLPTRVGHTANLDGYIAKGNTEIYVEAKCREIYGNHKNIEISHIYKRVYDFIKEQDDRFNYKDTTQTCKEGYFKCTFMFNNNEIVHFDIKQLICHFLGITAHILENKQNKNIKFIYLIFNPDEIKGNLSEKYKKSVLTTYHDAIKEIENFEDMRWLFDAVMKFQEIHLGLQLNNTISFEFVLADQNNYKKTLME